MDIRDIVKLYSKSVASYASHKYFYTFAFLYRPRALAGSSEEHQGFCHDLRLFLV